MLNYLRESLAFLEKASGLSPRTQVLWHYLLYLNNRAAVKDAAGEWQWPVWFAADNALLVRAMGLKSSSRIYNYRHALVSRGWVRYLGSGAWEKLAGIPAGGAAGAGRYALVPFTPGFEEKLCYPPGYPGGILLWSASLTPGGTASQEASDDAVNVINAVNHDILAKGNPASTPSPFDIIAQRGRDAANGIFPNRNL